jgi:serine/alanine adding enzyme
MPFVNYGGVLASRDDAARALVARAIDLTAASGGSHLELRHTRDRCPGLRARRHKVAMTLALEADADGQWQRLDRKVRNQVRKAEKSGVTVEEGGVDRLDAFYRVFARNMRDLGTPVYGRRFFREVLATFPATTRVFVARVNGAPAAASIVTWHRDTIEVPWASAVREFNPLCVNVLLYWAMLRFAVARGVRTFDFGRSTPDEGTFHFKRQWGAGPTPLVWEYWDAPGHAVRDLSPKNPSFGLAIRLWQRLPVPVATALGPHIVRHIP